MGSKQKETRTEQIEKYQQLLNSRTAELEEKGFKTDEIKKDRSVKHYNAEIKRTKNAISIINKRDQTIQETKTAKAEKKSKKEGNKDEPKKEKKGGNKEKSK